MTRLGHTHPLMELTVACMVVGGGADGGYRDSATVFPRSGPADASSSRGDVDPVSGEANAGPAGSRGLEIIDEETSHKIYLQV